MKLGIGKRVATVACCLMITNCAATRATDEAENVGDPSSDDVRRKHDAGADVASSTCGSLVGPDVSASCKGCGTHACQANGCYGGWWCETAENRCQAPPDPSTCGGSSDDAGPPSPSDAAPPPPPPSGAVGPSGGTVSTLRFAVVGDTRPPTIDDTKGYPSTVITKIYEDIQSLSPAVDFAVSTGDYMFSSTTSGQAAPQLDLYLAARSKYAGTLFPALGNHECTGATDSNCGAGNKDGVTDNFTQFLDKMLAPIGQTKPWYAVRVDANDKSWTSKLVFVAGNAWSSEQASWLDATLSSPTTYTFVIRHEPAAATTAPGVSPSSKILAAHPYTLLIVGHTHTYGKTGAKQVTIGNGGAPLVSSTNFGFGLITRRSDGAIQVDVLDKDSLAPDTSFRFALNADGSPAP